MEQHKLRGMAYNGIASPYRHRATTLLILCLFLVYILGNVLSNNKKCQQLNNKTSINKNKN